MFTNRLPWVILLVVWMAGSTWWHVCRIKQLCADSISPASPVASPPVPGLHVADSGRFQFDAAGNFAFARSGAVANTRGIDALFDSLAGYLKANPGKVLVISGYYSPLEQNETSFPNLGIARADGIKRAFSQRGVADSLLVLTAIKKYDLAFSATGDSLRGGLAFTFTSPQTASPQTPPLVVAPAEQPLAVLNEPVTEDGLARKERFTSVFEPIALYFPLGEAYYIKTGETTKFFDEAISFLNRNKNKTLVLTGYTDNSGPDAVNLRLARDRANAVKAQLRKSGIGSGQIRVVARGEADPKADNSTLSGRKANRRVTVVVQ